MYSITLNKLYRQIDKHTAAKRSMDREVAVDERLADLTAPEPSPVEVIAIIEQLHLVIHGLSPAERIALTSRLQGESIESIGELLGKSERTVRRHLAQAQRQIEQQLLAAQRPARVRRPKQDNSMLEPLAPLQYSDYVLEQLIGSGGMGKVYRATEKKTGDTVAVKALHKSRQSDKRAVHQFVQEAQILAKLSHPNVVRVDGLGRFPGGGYFIVMQFVNGMDLQSALKNGPLPFNEAVAIVKQVSGAVAHAHDHGIIHCDLKPGNVLFGSSNNQVYVTDFGFAFIVAGRSRTTSGSIGGTAGYMAPEILLGSQPTPAADIYSLGALLWTLATGKVPGGPHDLCVDSKRLSNTSSICRRCLAYDPSERYHNVVELIKDLNRL